MLKIKKLEIPKKYIYLLSFMIPFITVLVSLTAGGFAPFGTKDIMTAGGYDNLIPYFHEFHDRLFSGSLFRYSTNSGLGYDFTTVITYYLSDPTNFILFLFPNSTMLSIMNLLYAVKIGVAGLIFCHFLFYRTSTRKKDTDSFLIVAFSAAYALSSYMISYGINITYTMAIVLFPLLILGMDKIIIEKKWMTYLTAMTLIIFANIYIAIIVFLFSLFYMAVQDFRDVEHCVKSFTWKLISDFMSFGISAVIIVNSFNSLFFKNDINTNFYYHGMYGSIWDVIKMSLTHALPYQLDLNSNGVNIYAGTICILMIIPFLLNKELKLSYRVKNLALTLLLIIASYSITSNYFFNAFYFTLQYRAFFGFLICFMMLSISYDAVISIDSYKQITFIISFAVSLIMVILSMLFCSSYESVSPFITSMEILMILFLLCHLHLDFHLVHYPELTVLLFQLLVALSVI